METLDTIKSSRPRLEDLFKNYPELTKLNKLKEQAMANLDHPVVLSEIAVKMSGYLVRVGSLASELSALANEGYVMRKWRYLGSFHRMQGTVKEREGKAMDDTIEEHRIELSNKYLFDVINSYHSDFHNFVGVIQSRLKVLQSER